MAGHCTHAGIVLIQDSHAIGGQRFHEFALRPGDIVERARVLGVHGFDVCHNAHVGTCDVTQKANVPRHVHPHLKDDPEPFRFGDICARGGPQAQQRQRQSELVVKRALASHDVVPLLEHLRRNFLRRRLAHAAGNSDDTNRQLLPPPASCILHGFKDVVDTHHHRDAYRAGPGVLLPQIQDIHRFRHRHVILHNSSHRAPRQCIVHIRVPVNVLTGERKEDGPRLSLARIDHRHDRNIGRVQRPTGQRLDEVRQRQSAPPGTSARHHPVERHCSGSTTGSVGGMPNRTKSRDATDWNTGPAVCVPHRR